MKNNTMKLLECINNINESANEEMLNKIAFVKRALNQSMNMNNYKDKSFNQLREIYNYYKDKFNNSNIEKYVVYIVIYNKFKNLANVGYLSDNGKFGEQEDCTLFDNKTDAESSLKEFINNIPSQWEIYEPDTKVIKLKI